MLCQWFSEQAKCSAFLRSIGSCLEVFISAHKKQGNTSFEDQQMLFAVDAAVVHKKRQLPCSKG